MIRPRTLIAMMCGTLTLVCAGTSLAMVHSASSLEARVFAGGAPRSRTQPWWSGFRDETMNKLIAAAQSRSSSAPSESLLNTAREEFRIAAAYVAIKVETLGLLYVENARSAVVRQSQLLNSEHPTHSDFTLQLARRLTTADAAIGKLKSQRAADLVFLAAQCQMSEAALNDTIADALLDRALPRFAALVPDDLPMAILADREDVRLVATLYDIDVASTLDGAIDAGGSSADEFSIGYPLYDTVVAKARKEVSESLHRLQNQSDVTNSAYAKVLDARTDFEASKTRLDRRGISEIQLMEDFQGLMLDLQALAVANGDLAVAWIAFMGSLGSGASISADANSQSMQTQIPHKFSRKLRDP